MIFDFAHYFLAFSSISTISEMSLEIEFNKSDGNYAAGDVISGTITIINDEPIEVTGMKMDMFIHSRFVIPAIPYYDDERGRRRVVEWTPPSMMLDLASEFFDGKKEKSKILESGSHHIPFTFPALASDYSYSFDDEDSTFCRHFVRTNLDIKHKGSISAKKGFEVTVIPLDDNPAALGWQTQSLTKHLKPSGRKVTMKITVPTGIANEESVPIQISISNTSKNPMILVRSRLVKIYHLPKDFETQDTFSVVSHAVEEFTEQGEYVHLLNVNTDKLSHDGPVTSDTYRIEIESETANGKLLQLNFPVIVGKWKEGPIRSQQT